MKHAAIRYAEILEAGAWVTHQEQEDIAKLLRKLAMTEDEAWDLLEAKQKKTKAKTVTERDALKIAYNALIEIDKETPYPLAKHAAMVVKSVLEAPAQDWEAVAADQAMTIALLRDDLRQSLEQPWDTSDMAHRPNGLSVEQSKNPLDIADRAYFAGKKDGIDETMALIKSKDNG